MPASSKPIPILIKNSEKPVMLTENFYITKGENAMLSGRGGSRQGSIDAPKRGQGGARGKEILNFKV